MEFFKHLLMVLVTLIILVQIGLTVMVTSLFNGEWGEGVELVSITMYTLLFLTIVFELVITYVIYNWNDQRIKKIYVDSDDEEIELLK